MNAEIRQLIEALHDCPFQYMLAATGGGTGAVAQLLSVPGGSRCILEVLVPYHEQSLTEFLGRRPENCCSVATTLALAQRAFERARWLAVLRQAVAGVACTATLATDRAKRGDHRFHLAIHTAAHTLSWSLTLNKGARDREGEEAVLDGVLLNAMAEVFGVGRSIPVPLLPGEEVQQEEQPANPLLSGFLTGEHLSICVETDGRLRTNPAKPAALLPGSFNPVHQAHLGLAAAASQFLATPVAFELSVTNVDKEALSVHEICWRLQQFGSQAPVWLTRAATFVEKAALFPGTVFVVGSDTAGRVLDPKYYQDNEVKMMEALEGIRGLGCRFLVAGRVDATGKFIGIDELSVPAKYRELFQSIPFRVDISSTQLRRSP